MMKIIIDTAEELRLLVRLLLIFSCVWKVCSGYKGECLSDKGK